MKNSLRITSDTNHTSDNLIVMGIFLFFGLLLSSTLIWEFDDSELKKYLKKWKRKNLGI